MRPVLGTVIFEARNAPPNPVVWEEARTVLLDWHVHGKAQIVRDGAPMDIATLATIEAASELVGATLVIFDEGVVSAWGARGA